MTDPQLRYCWLLDEFPDTEGSCWCPHMEVDVSHVSLVSERSVSQLKTFSTVARSHWMPSLCYGTPDKWSHPPFSIPDSDDEDPNSLYRLNGGGGFWSSLSKARDMHLNDSSLLGPILLVGQKAFGAFGPVLTSRAILRREKVMFERVRLKHHRLCCIVLKLRRPNTNPISFVTSVIFPSGRYIYLKWMSRLVHDEPVQIF